MCSAWSRQTLEGTPSAQCPSLLKLTRNVNPPFQYGWRTMLSDIEHPESTARIDIGWGQSEISRRIAINFLFFLCFQCEIARNLNPWSCCASHPYIVSCRMAVYIVRNNMGKLPQKSAETTHIRISLACNSHEGKRAQSIHTKELSFAGII